MDASLSLTEKTLCWVTDGPRSVPEVFLVKMARHTKREPYNPESDYVRSLAWKLFNEWAEIVEAVEAETDLEVSHSVWEAYKDSEIWKEQTNSASQTDTQNPCRRLLFRLASKYHKRIATDFRLNPRTTQW